MNTPATKLLIRPAREADCESASRVCWRSKAVWGYDDEFMDRCRDALAVTPERLERESVFIAEAPTGELVGVTSVSVVADAVGAAELELLFVAPEAMRSGVGGALLDCARRTARGLGATVLWILSDPGAEPFYRRCGAVRVGERPSDAIAGRRLPWLRLAL